MPTTQHNIPALSIAESLAAALKTTPFVGRVRLVTRTAVLASTENDTRWLAVLSEGAGNGPFSIVVGSLAAATTGCDASCSVDANEKEVRLGPWRVDLGAAQLWNAQLGSSRRGSVKGLADKLESWRDLKLDQIEGLSSTVCDRLVEGAETLRAAILGSGDLEMAARRLAGVGPGLTPAGDDYLVGACVALRLAGKTDDSVSIARAAAGATTTLSRSYFQSAERGEFAEPWHTLAAALRTPIDQSPGAVDRALRRVERFGATSGRVAAVGCVQTAVAVSARVSAVPRWLSL